MTDPALNFESSPMEKALTAAEMRAERAKERLAAQAALILARKEAEARWKADPFSWYLDRVTLLDPLAEGEKVAPFPDFPYLRAMVHELATTNVLVVWKSRRMIASWTAICWAVRLCTLYPHMRCFFIAKKEGETDAEGSRELVWRARFVAQNLRGGPKPRIEAGKLHIAFPETGSSITGVSSDPNVMRQVAANFVLGDELGFWDRPRESYAALKPTLEQRGQFVGLSSSAEGFFKDMVLDIPEHGGSPRQGHAYVIPERGVVAPQWVVQAEEDDAPARVIHASEPEPFAAWTNPHNGVRVFAAHYLADPRKQGPEWRAREQAGVTRSIWLTEYEMQFNVHAGRPVFMHEWSTQSMLKPSIKMERERPIWVSLDFGFHHPAMVCGQMRYGQQMVVMRAIQGEAMAFEDFMRLVLSSLNQWFPTRELNPEVNDFIWCCDRSGDKETSVGEAEVRIMKRLFGIKPKYRATRIEAGMDLLRSLMSRTHRGEPCFLVDRNSTTALVVQALNGGYSYPTERATSNKATMELPVKDNIHDHVMDCIRYAAVCYGPKLNHNSALTNYISKVDIPHMPTYTF